MELTFGVGFGLFVFVLTGLFYGLRTTDVKGYEAILIAVASNLMAFTIFGVLFTLIWSVFLLFGVNLGIPKFGMVLGYFVVSALGGFVLGYVSGLLFKPDHREVK